MTNWNKCGCGTNSCGCGTSTSESMCTLLGNIYASLQNLQGVVSGGIASLFSPLTSIYTLDNRAHVAGSANRQLVVAGSPLQLSANSYRYVIIRHPVANSQDAVISISANTVTMSPGDPDLVIDYRAENVVDTPAITVTPDATETGALIVDTVSWSNA